LAVDGVVALDLDDQAGITQADPITGGGSEHFGIGAPVHAAHNGPMILPSQPYTSPPPARRTSAICRVWPGTKRTAVPAGISRRNPRAAWRSKRNASLASWKWEWGPTWTGRSPGLATV